MNTRFSILRTLIVATLTATLFTSCIKDKYDEPEQLPDEDPGLEVNLTIEQLKNLYKTDPVQITEDYIISGIVISDDQSGNIYQTLIIQDATGGVGFRIQRSDLFTDFPFGRKVYVQLKGLTVGAYNNLIQVGAADDGAGGVTIIPAAFVDDYFVKGPRNQVVTPLEIGIADLSSKYQNMLIKLKAVEFISAQAGKTTYADAIKQQSASTTLEDCDGNKIDVRTSGYSSFAADTIPAGKGDVVAIYQIYRTSNQLVLNKVSDVQLTDTSRCGGGTVEPTDSIPSKPGDNAVLLFSGADFEDFNLFKTQIDNFGLKPYAVSATGEGWNASNALALRGTPTGNDYVFSIKASSTATFTSGAKKLSFYVKGTSAKSLSLNIYKADGSSYTAFNVGDLSSNKLITSQTSNQYTGTINTNGNWVLVTLDLTGVELNTSQSGTLMALKVGKDAAYDLLIDDIVIW